MDRPATAIKERCDALRSDGRRYFRGDSEAESSVGPLAVLGP